MPSSGCSETSRIHTQMSEQFLSALNSHIEETTIKYRTQGPEIASILVASLFDFGNVESTLWKLSVKQSSKDAKIVSGQATITPEQEDSIKEEQRQAYFKSLTDRTEGPNVGTPNFAHFTADSTNKDANFPELRKRLLMPAICFA